MQEIDRKQLEQVQGGFISPPSPRTTWGKWGARVAGRFGGEAGRFGGVAGDLAHDAVYGAPIGNY